jgi:hypothetical protein
VAGKPPDVGAEIVTANGMVSANPLETEREGE